jgi:hypothetical protein
MDPIANLDEQARIIASTTPDLERLGELVEALDGWLASGGFIPAGWSAQTLRVQRSEAIVFMRDRWESAAF